MTYIAGNIVCLAPSGRLEGAGAFRGFMGPFAQILTGSKLIAAFGDDEKAVVMYDTDTDTVLVKDAPGAECVTVRDGKITNMRIIFDRLPFEEARRAAGTQ
jgi:ketosteroid isomerase-like protein